MYVLLYEKKRALKSEKWNPQALRRTLVGYDGHTIYRVHIREQNKIIRIKDLRIFEDYETKTTTDLPNYKNAPTFQDSLLSDDNNNVDTKTLDEDRKVSNTTSVSRQTPSKVTPSGSKKVVDTRDETT